MFKTETELNCQTHAGCRRIADSEYVYIQCVDPGEPYTPGGTVIFKFERLVKAEASNEDCCCFRNKA